MLKTLTLLTVTATCFSAYAVASDSGAEDAFGKVLLREEIDTGSAPSFLDEALQLEGFRHLSVEDRLGHERAFPFLVQLQTAALKEHSLESLQRQLGDVDLSHYVPHNTFLLHTSHAHAAQIAANAALVRWVGNLHPAHKLAPSVAQYHPDHVPVNELVVQVAPQQSEAELQAVLSDIISRAKENGLTGIEGRVGTNSRFNLRLSGEFHMELAEFLTNQPEVEYVDRNFPEQIANAFAKTIIWEGKEITTANSELRTTRNQLDGEGQVVGIADSGIARHSCFFKQDTFIGSSAYKRWTSAATAEDISCASDFATSNRKIVQYVGYADYADANDLQVGHGTHVAGSIVGSLSSGEGDSELGKFQGMAPAAKVAFFDVANGYSQGLNFPTDLQKDMLNWAYVATARVHSNSWGKSSLFGGSASYDSSSRDFDEFMWTHKDFLIVAAAGNSGGCNAKNSVSSPANAKNVLTVGATLNSKESWDYVKSEIGSSSDSLFQNFWSTHPEDFNSDTVAAFSSIGATTDLRLKPDVTAPGYYITSAFNAAKDGQCTTPLFGKTIRMEAGTSQATPQVAGSALLVRQYFMEGFYPSGARNAANAFTPSASLVKAVIINSAVNMKGVKHQIPYGFFDFCSITRNQLTQRPSIYQGFGRMSLDSVLQFANEPSSLIRTTFIPSLNSSAADVFFDSSLSTGQIHTYKYCTSANSEQELRVTLVWTDAPPSLVASRKLVNDLDLTVQIGSTILYGNGQGSYRTEVTELAGSTKDSVNPVESVYFTPSSSSASQDVVLTVTGFNVPMGPQPYSLVISGAITEGECGSNIASQPAITENSVIDVPIPSNTACRNVYAIDDSPDPESSTPSPTYYPYPTYDYPTYSPSPYPSPREPKSGTNLIIIIASVVGAIFLVAIIITILIVRKPNDIKKPLLQTPSNA